MKHEEFVQIQEGENYTYYTANKDDVWSLLYVLTKDNDMKMYTDYATGEITDGSHPLVIRVNK